MNTRKAKVTYSLCLASLATAAGFWAGNTMAGSAAQDGKNGLGEKTYAGVKATNHADNDYGLGDGHVSKLKPYPQLKAGERTPFDLWRYAGKNGPSWKAPVLDMPWDQWVKMCKAQKPKLMADVQAYMNGRYHFHGKPLPVVKMSRGK